MGSKILCETVDEFNKCQKAVQQFGTSVRDNVIVTEMNFGIIAISVLLSSSTDTLYITKNYLLESIRCAYKDDKFITVITGRLSLDGAYCDVNLRIESPKSVEVIFNCG